MADRSDTSILERVVWAIVALICLGGLATLYLWSDGDLFIRLFDHGTLWERLNFAAAIAGLVGLTIHGGYRALRFSNPSTKGS